MIRYTIFYDSIWLYFSSVLMLCAVALRTLGIQVVLNYDTSGFRIRREFSQFCRCFGPNFVRGLLKQSHVLFGFQGPSI